MSKNITVNGTTYDASYVSAPLADGGGNATFRESSELSLQSKSVTPTESQQTVTPASDYFALDKVTVGAIPSEYVKPTSKNAGGELMAGSTIPAGTYFTGEATVPSSGGLADGQIAVYWPYPNGKILVSDPVTLTSSSTAVTTKAQPISFVLPEEITARGVYSIVCDATGGTAVWAGGYGYIKPAGSTSIERTFNAVRNEGYPITGGAADPVVEIADGATTVTITTGSNYSWAKGTYRMIYVTANAGGIF